jgi:uncharacterized protein DUF1064
MKDQITAADFRELNFQVTPQMKYRNKITVIDDIRFDSQKEAKYYGKLKLLQAAGDIISFSMQVRYDFDINGVKIGYYKADFVELWKSGKTVVVDVKGMKTLPVYRLKKKLMLALHNITIKEV